MLVVVVLLGLVGGVAIASVAGARRTASTFDAYQGDVRFSHVAVNTFIPDLERVEAIAALPGVDSSATYLGLSGFPLVDGKVVEDFRYTGVFGSLDGRFFTQDRATVVDGRLPRLDATDEIAFTPVQARFMKAGVGDTVTYLYRDNETTYRRRPSPRRSTGDRPRRDHPLAHREVWIRFAEVVGVVPVPAVPLATAGVAILALGACGLLAMVPATLAARTTAAHQLRSE